MKYANTELTKELSRVGAEAQLKLAGISTDLLNAERDKDTHPVAASLGVAWALCQEACAVVAAMAVAVHPDNATGIAITAIKALQDDLTSSTLTRVELLLKSFPS